MRVLHKCAKLFEDDQVEHVSLHALYDPAAPQQRHSLTWSRVIWQEHPTHPTSPSVLAYEMATDYFIGELVTGELVRDMNGQKGYLPRQLY